MDEQQRQLYSRLLHAAQRMCSDGGPLHREACERLERDWCDCGARNLKRAVEAVTTYEAQNRPRSQTTPIANSPDCP